MYGRDIVVGLDDATWLKSLHLENITYIIYF